MDSSASIPATAPSACGSAGRSGGTPTEALPLTPAAARRLAIAKQRLAGTPRSATVDDIFTLVRDLGCLQIDPTNAVARSHLLVLWSRFGRYDPAHLDTLLWRERRLFEFWAHAASIVCTEDYPLFRQVTDWYTPSDSPAAGRFQVWLRKNDALRRHVLAEIRRHGPLPSRAIQDLAASDWPSTGWSAGRNVPRILTYLWHTRKIVVAGRTGGQRLWDLADRVLPDWTPRERLRTPDITRRAAERSLRALGAATPQHIRQHFIRGHYPGLDRALEDLETQGRVVRVRVGDGGQAWPGAWYVHADDVPLLDRLNGRHWDARTTLLSPFDNLICDRARTDFFFYFRFSIEIYTPRAQRVHGFFVMPILHGDRVIGRVDQKMDRDRRRLIVHGVRAEPGAPRSAAVGRAVAGAIEDLARFLGAEHVEFSRRVPRSWAQALR